MQHLVAVPNPGRHISIEVLRNSTSNRVGFHLDRLAIWTQNL